MYTSGKKKKSRFVADRSSTLIADTIVLKCILHTFTKEVDGVAGSSQGPCSGVHTKRDQKTEDTQRPEDQKTRERERERERKIRRHQREFEREIETERQRHGKRDRIRYYTQ
jgi:hypothetical protein